VVLVGFMGAGKSTVGRILARRLGVQFVDSDEVLTARTGRTPREIFAADGEPAFRALEREVVAELLGSRPARVVALGGGATEDARTRSVLRGARVVHLEVSHGEVLARVGNDPGRPVLTRPDLPELHRNRLAAYREVAYAVVRTDGLTPDEVADAVLAALTTADPSGSPDQLVQ
jgi:shikimate kinase